MPSLGTLGQLLKLPPLSTQKCHSAGPPNCLLPSTVIFFKVKPHTKFQNPRTTPSGRKDSGGSPASQPQPKYKQGLRQDSEDATLNNDTYST